jgi:hypothetical protein|uniref:Uncharacterized protein n=1 Tax=Picea glauca TaxID=3330 RepID=A0A117NGS0_PICGL|nr:hypothetical protein ABT39_MTgene5427 [Picea glauca]
MKVRRTVIKKLGLVEGWFLAHILAKPSVQKESHKESHAIEALGKPKVNVTRAI